MFEMKLMKAKADQLAVGLDKLVNDTDSDGPTTFADPFAHMKRALKKLRAKMRQQTSDEQGSKGWIHQVPADQQRR